MEYGNMSKGQLIQKLIDLKKLNSILKDDRDRLLSQLKKWEVLFKQKKVLDEKKIQVTSGETRKEVSSFKKTYSGVVDTGNIVVASPQMEKIIHLADKFHNDRSIPVLIQGETGTGKEVIARYIHYNNREVSAPFIDINCAAINSNIFESELFGYEAGTFTGGLPAGQKGKLDLALGGTIFFDEITELTVELQAKLLRFIQEKEYYRVGGLKKIDADVRIICATNDDILKKVEQGTFRQDLFYRIGVGSFIIPPLRERKEEIIPLAATFLKHFATKKGKRFVKINAAAVEFLMNYNWPGNVRELKNVIEWATFMYDDFELRSNHIEFQPIYKLNHAINQDSGDRTATYADYVPLPAGGFDINEHYNKLLNRALDMHQGNKTKTARYLGIPRHKLYQQLKKKQNT